MKEMSNFVDENYLTFVVYHVKIKQIQNRLAFRQKIP